MIIRSKAPLRLGFAGGGTDIYAYASQFGGAILNATISMYAHVSIQPLAGDVIEFESPDRNMSTSIALSDKLDILDDYQLHCGVYNRLVRDYNIPQTAFKMTSFVDAPPGSGLGSSSTLVVAMLSAFCAWHHLPLGEYEIAQLAYEIERNDLNLAGGKQDQFVATFGGFNFMEFNKDGSVLVNPLRISSALANELEYRCLLLHTKTSRHSAQIINEQIASVTKDGSNKIDALHKVKESAYIIKNALLMGKFKELGQALHESWLQKKSTAKNISNNNIDSIYETALKAGAIGGKISGAGGGGYMFLICEHDKRHEVINAVKHMADVIPFNFTKSGTVSWRTKIGK